MLNSLDMYLKLLMPGSNQEFQKGWVWHSRMLGVPDSQNGDHTHLACLHVCCSPDLTSPYLALALESSKFITQLTLIVNIKVWLIRQIVLVWAEQQNPPIFASTHQGCHSNSNQKNWTRYAAGKIYVGRICPSKLISSKCWATVLLLVVWPG